MFWRWQPITKRRDIAISRGAETIILLYIFAHIVHIVLLSIIVVLYTKLHTLPGSMFFLSFLDR